MKTIGQLSCHPRTFRLEFDVGHGVILQGVSNLPAMVSSGYQVELMTTRTVCDRMVRYPQGLALISIVQLFPGGIRV